MPLSDVVQRAADNLTRAAERLERGMNQVGTAGGRLGQAAAGAAGAALPGLVGGAPAGGVGLGTAVVQGAAAGLAARLLCGAPGIAGGAVAAGGGAVAARQALAVAVPAAQTGTALAVLAREVMQAAASAAVFTVTLRRAAGLVPVPGGGGGGGIPMLPGPANAIGFPGGPVVPYGGPRVRVVGATANQPGAGRHVADVPGGWDAQLTTFSGNLKALNPVVVAATGAFYTALRLVEKANPSAAATFSNSLDLLSAKIGRTLVPVIDEASRGLQGVGGVVDAVRPLLSALNSRRNPFSIPGMLGPVNDALQQMGLTGPMMRSIQAPFQTGFMGGEQYRDTLQSAMLQTDELQARLLQEQLEATREWLGHARTIAADLAAFRALLPTFR